MTLVRCKNDELFAEYLTFGEVYELRSVSPDGETATVRVASGHDVGFPACCFDLSGDALAFQPRSVWIEAEQWAAGEWDEVDTNSDVTVTFGDGSRWVASIFTYANIMTLARRHKETGECLRGGYLWSSDLVLIERASRARIEEMIADLLRSGDFETVFRTIGPEAGDAA